MRADRLVALALALLACAAAGPVLWARAIWMWNDSLMTAVALDDLHRAVLGLGDWTRGSLGWPLAGAVTAVDWLGGPALLSMPLHLLGLDPLDEHAIICLLGLGLTAWTCHKVARVLLGAGPHTAVAALVGGFHPLALAHLPYANLSHGELGLLGALALGWGLHRSQARVAALGGLLLGGAGWFGFYQAAHAGLLGGVVILAAGLARRGDRRSWGAAILGAIIGALTLMPVATVYLAFQRSHGVQTELAALVAESWDPGRPFLYGHGDTPGGGSLGGVGLMSKAGLILGVGLAVAGVAGLRREALRWVWAAVLGLGGLAVLLAMGPELLWRGAQTGWPLPGRWILSLPGLDGLRAPVRWLDLAFVSLGLLAARGVRGLALRWPTGGRAAAIALAGALAGLLVHPVPSEPRSRLALPSVYARIAASEHPGALLDLQPSGRSSSCTCHLGHRLRAEMLHHRPLVGGLYARRIDALVQLDRLAARWPGREAAELLRRIGVGFVLEHGVQGELRLEGVSCTMDEGHRLCALDPWPSPLVARADLTPVKAGPVDALRWTKAPSASAVQVRCDGEELSYPVAVWRVITQLQGGTGLEVQLDRRCQTVETEAGAPVRLRAPDGAQAWPTARGDGARPVNTLP